jgi:hypothetical protein
LQQFSQDSVLGWKPSPRPVWLFAVPSGQVLALHASLPCSSWYLPAAQLMQPEAAAAPAAEYLPTLQLLAHSVASTVRSAGLVVPPPYLPPAQPVQALLPAAVW